METHDEEMKSFRKSLNEEKIKKVEAINKLAQVGYYGYRGGESGWQLVQVDAGR